MNLKQLFLILKSRIRVFVSVFLATLAIVILVTLMLSKSYTADAALIFKIKGADPVTGLAQPISVLGSYMTTQMDVIRSYRVSLKVVDKLQIDKNPNMQKRYQSATGGVGDIRHWAANLLATNLSVVPSRDSGVLTLSYTSSDPEFSKLVANTFAEAYLETNVEMANEPSIKALEFLSKKKQQLRAEFLAAQSALASYLQEQGITSSIENADIENAKLTDLTAQLSAAQSQSLEALNRNKAAGNTETSPDILANPLIQNLKIQITTSQAKLADLTKRLGSNHPQVMSAKAELEQIQSDYAKQIAQVQTTIGSSANIYKKREAELKASVDEQKKRLLALNRSRDQVSVLQKEVENAQLAYNNINQRYSESTLQGTSTEGDVLLLSNAVTPTSPSKPNVIFNIVFGILAGLFLGLLVAFVREFIDRRVRCVDDIEYLLDMPVLVSLPSGKHLASNPKPPFGFLTFKR